MTTEGGRNDGHPRQQDRVHVDRGSGRLPFWSASRWSWMEAIAAGVIGGAALVDYGISREDLLLMGAITGLGVGALQALVLSRSRVSGAFWWALANHQPGHLAGW